MEALQKTNEEEGWESHLQGTECFKLLFSGVLGIRPVFKVKDIPKCLDGWQPECSAPSRTEPFAGVWDRDYHY